MSSELPDLEILVENAASGGDPPGVNADQMVAHAPEGAAWQAGANVRMLADGHGGQYFIADIEGVLKMAPPVISIVRFLAVDGDVGCETGNLTFDGDVLIKGSIKQQYSATAGGDITVMGNVEAGASINANGNVTVHKQIVGGQTSVLALGDVRCHTVYEATVQAGRNLRVGSSVYHGDVRAGGVLKVSKGGGSNAGSVIGGESWGVRGIDMYTAGSRSGVSTSITAGVDPVVAYKLGELDRKIENANQYIMRYLSRFRLNRVDVEVIKKKLALAHGYEKEVLARTARRLARIVQVNQRLVKTRQQITRGLPGKSATSFIRIADTAYPGVLLRLGGSMEKVQTATSAIVIGDPAGEQDE